MKRIAFLPILLAGAINISWAHDEQCPNPAILENEACMELAYQSADSSLNSAYQKLMAKLGHQSGPRISHGKTLKDSLKQSQLDWLKFRDSNCAFEAFPATDNPSGYAHLTNSCMLRMTNERTNELLKSL